jgi:hypothetical protein
MEAALTVASFFGSSGNFVEMRGSLGSEGKSLSDERTCAGKKVP